MPTETNLTPAEAAARLRHSVETLRGWRSTGRGGGFGPRYIKFGKRVLYPVAEIEAFERAHLKDHTNAS